MAIAFTEPGWIDLAIILSFLYFLQVSRNLANSLLGAGLLGEIACGIVYGPVAHLLRDDWEQTFLLLGYIGLLLIVFEGGLEFDPSLFLSTVPLATLTALVGVLLPIAFTFALFSAFSYPPITAFTAGAALASTSLGTTFYVLRAQKSPDLDLSATRVGTTLVAAALIDDIISLVLLSVITNLAEGVEGNQLRNLGWIIGRPIVASVALAVIAPLVTFVLARPTYRRGLESYMVQGGANAYLLFGLLSLSGFLAIAYYAGTTMLLGAFLAGIFVSSMPTPSSSAPEPPFTKTYQDLISPLQNHIFSSLFFASIGYTIPFLSLWTGRIIWRGILYAILMLLGKLLAGSCILLADCVTISFSSRHASQLPPSHSSALAAFNTEAEKSSYPTRLSPQSSSSNPRHSSHFFPYIALHLPSQPSTTLSSSLFLGSALIARGEIGVLVLQVAHSASTSSNGREVLGDEPYFVALWAVALCTIVGPVMFSGVVKRWGRGIGEGSWGVVREVR